MSLQLEPLDLSLLSDFESPSLLVFAGTLRRNLAKMVEIAGDVGRLRPHCKTHKMREVIQLQIAAGITKHKCATLAEAEMLADCGVQDVFWAYPPVGPNVRRLVEYRRRFPAVALTVTTDDAAAAQALSRAVTAAQTDVGVLLDLDTGLQRTGVTAGPGAVSLYRRISGLPGLRAGGIHLYDGQNHQTDLRERRAAVRAVWEAAVQLRDRLVAEQLSVPAIVAGGTGSFPIFAEFRDPVLELSPGTCLFHDAGYAHLFPDLPFQPAAALLTRVISRPSSHRVTLDLGYKACASDPPLDRRVVVPALPSARIVLQNEEHLVLETAEACSLAVGDPLLAVPWHICPTCALHQAAYVIHPPYSGTDAGTSAANLPAADLPAADEMLQVERWAVAARDRRLTI